MTKIITVNGNAIAVNGNALVCDDVGVDTSDATVTSGAQILYPYTAYADDIKYTGNIQSLGATTYYPSTSDQTISSTQYLSGTQTIKGVLLTNLTAANIANGVTVKVGDSVDDDRIISITGTLSGSSWTLLGYKDLTVSTTSTTAAAITNGTLTYSAAYTSNKIVYVKVRDKAGPRSGYFIGSDTIFFNPYPANSATTDLTSSLKAIHRYNNGTYTTYNTTSGYGIYPYSITYAGVITMYSRYSSTNTLTINGTYRVEVYTLDYPTNAGNPYTYTSFS